MPQHADVHAVAPPADGSKEQGYVMLLLFPSKPFFVVALPAEDRLPLLLVSNSGITHRLCHPQQAGIAQCSNCRTL